MSLIDGLIDELNKSADEWNESNMFELARMCRNAAYTILETRNDAELLRRMWKQARLEAQGFKAENAKLRDELDAAKHDLSLFSERIVELGAENAKLRELVDGLTWCCEHYRCRQECPLYDVSEPDHCREVSIKRELGVEVDE